MKDLSEKLKKAFEDSNISYVEFQRMTGIPKSALQRYVMGENKIPLDRLEKMADALGVSAAYLMGWEDAPSYDAVGTAVGEIVRFPIIANVAAGYNALAIEEWTGDYEEIPLSEVKGNPDEYRIMRVKGDSMYPLIMAGDSILIHLQCTLESGDIGVIIYNGDEATIKRIKWNEDHSELSLIPSNPEYMMKVIEKENLAACRIYGKVVKVIRNF